MPDQNGARIERPTSTDGAAGPIRDHRAKPVGVLPRHVQMWLMIGLSGIILAIIFFTGRPEPATQVTGSARSSGAPASIQPERVRSYQDRLADQEARLRREMVEQGTSRLPEAPILAGDLPVQGAVAADPLADERRRREYESLFADNVALSRRPEDRQTYGQNRGQARRREASEIGSGVPTFVPPVPSPQELAAFQQFLGSIQANAPGAANAAATEPTLSRSPSRSTAVDASPYDDTERSSRPRETQPISADGPLHRLLEGTVIEAVLTNRLDGAFSGPVNCLVTTPVYSHSRQHIVIPAGSRVLGAASAVQGWGESRLAVSFHRLVMPDGRTHSLERFMGINQVGETGLEDQVDRHYMRVFGASLAIGALSGLAQYNTRGGFDGYTFGDAYRQSAGASLATSSGRVLDRYLNVLPTVTIREGHRIKIYLTNDLELPAYQDLTAMSPPTMRVGPVRQAASQGGTR